VGMGCGWRRRRTVRRDSQASALGRAWYSMEGGKRSAETRSVRCASKPSEDAEADEQHCFDLAAPSSPPKHVKNCSSQRRSPDALSGMPTRGALSVAHTPAAVEVRLPLIQSTKTSRPRAGKRIQNRPTALFFGKPQI